MVLLEVGDERVFRLVLLLTRHVPEIVETGKVGVALDHALCCIVFSSMTPREASTNSSTSILALCAKIRLTPGQDRLTLPHAGMAGTRLAKALP